MHLNPIFPALGLVASLAIPSALQAAERRYSIVDFDEVRIIGNHSVDVRIGRGTMVSAIGDPAALDGMSVETQGRTLVIQSLQQSLSSWKQPVIGAARVTITVPQLRGVRLEGGGSADIAELRGPQTSVSLIGSGVLTIARLTSDRSNIRIAGSGRLTLAGDVKNLDINIRGPGDISAEQLSVSDLKILSAGSGHVSIKALRSADVKQNGAGEIIVTGGPACAVETLGTGTVICGE